MEGRLVPQPDVDTLGKIIGPKGAVKMDRLELEQEETPKSAVIKLKR